VEKNDMNGTNRLSPARGVGAESYRRRRAARSGHLAPRKGAGWQTLPGIALALAFGSAGACYTVPVSGRTSINVFHPSEDIEIGREAYVQLLADETLAGPGPERDRVERVLSRLAAVAADEGGAWEWEVALIVNDEIANAFALPGGKMAVYTGLLDVCRTEAGLAVVMGHEIAHVLARHGTERITQAMGVDLALAAVDNGDTRRLAGMAIQLLYGMPFGRQMESEADRIGLITMARAGYDPREAIAFWERMERRSGPRPPEFLSTHPSHETRIQRLRERMPEALAAWRGP
jgi:predicted Zn-dependent protease